MTYEQQSSFAGYDQSGLTPEELLARLIALQSKISSTMSDVKRTTDSLTEKQSQISQDVESISLEVFQIDTTNGEKTSRISSLELRADGIETEVFYIDELGAARSRITQLAAQINSVVTVDLVGLDGRIATAESSISQNATAISQRVSYTDYNGEQIASLINQSAANITLSAESIDLDGITRINGNVQIGSNLDTGPKSLVFQGNQGIYSNGTMLTIGANRLDIDATDVNFVNVTRVTGLPPQYLRFG